MRRHLGIRKHSGLIVETLTWWGLCLGLWIVTLSAISGQELLVATPAALTSGVLATAARRAAGNRWRVRIRWVTPARLLPAAIVADGVGVLLAAFRRPAGSFAERTISEAGGDEAAARGRRATATILITLTPGSVVTDIDNETGLATLHRLGSGRPSMEESVSR